VAVLNVQAVSADGSVELSSAPIAMISAPSRLGVALPLVTDPLPLSETSRRALMAVNACADATVPPETSTPAMRITPATVFEGPALLMLSDVSVPSAILIAAPKRWPSTVRRGSKSSVNPLGQVK
jgi:hypothetical protein